jgi:putative intracellular protease/amidase
MEALADHEDQSTHAGFQCLPIANLPRNTIINKTMTTEEGLRIGVMLEAVQLTDVACMDILGNISEEYVDVLATAFPGFEHLKGKGIPITWYFISSSLELAPSTPFGFKVAPNVTYDDCPRDLDIVLTGGPPPSHRPAAAAKFIKEAWPQTRVWITTCVGSLWIADAGVLDGHKITTNRGFLDMAKQLHPNIDWHDQRWVVDEKPYTGKKGKGELWTAGGAGAGKHCNHLALTLKLNEAGNDMVAQFALKTFDPALVTALALDPLEFNPAGSKTQFY